MDENTNRGEHGAGALVDTPKEKLRSIGIAALLCLASLPAHAGNYVFATFTGDALADEQPSIYRSADVLDFTLSPTRASPACSAGAPALHRCDGGGTSRSCVQADLLNRVTNGKPDDD
jgi:hypothetical protein